MAKTCLVVSRFGNFSFSLEGHTGVVYCLLTFQCFQWRKKMLKFLLLHPMSSQVLHGSSTVRGS